MRLSFILLPLVALISGCATPEQDAERAGAICNQSGYQVGSPDYEQCIGRQVAEIQQTRQEVAEAFAVGLQSYGAATQAQAQAAANRRTTCTSTQFGNTVRTNCY